VIGVKKDFAGKMLDFANGLDAILVDFPLLDLD
jgi:hypothetical protein